MTPRYPGNPATDSMATFTLFPKGTYEFTISSSKAFESKDSQTGDVKNYGVRQTLICESEGAYKGKKLTFTHYRHTEGGRGISKNFLMAAYGFEVEDTNEEEFNELVAGYDWGFDPESSFVGEGWSKTHGSRVILVLDSVTEKDLKDPSKVRENQKFSKFMPIK